jgi:hypothetical protein
MGYARIARIHSSHWGGNERLAVVDGSRGRGGDYAAESREPRFLVYEPFKLPLEVYGQVNFGMPCFPLLFIQSASKAEMKI